MVKPVVVITGMSVNQVHNLFACVPDAVRGHPGWGASSSQHALSHTHTHMHTRGASSPKHTNCDKKIRLVVRNPPHTARTQHFQVCKLMGLFRPDVSRFYVHTWQTFTNMTCSAPLFGY